MVARNLKQEALNAKQGDQKPPVIVRPSKLAAEGVTGKVAEGVFEKAEPNRFNKEKKDFFIRADDGTLYIVNSTQSLEEQMSLIEAGQGIKIEIQYAGKVPTKSGRTVHDFTVFVADPDDKK